VFVESEEAIKKSSSRDTANSIFSLFFLPIFHHYKFIL